MRFTKRVLQQKTRKTCSGLFWVVVPFNNSRKRHKGFHDFIRITLVIKQLETRAGGSSKNVEGGSTIINGLCFKVIQALKAVEVNLSLASLTWQRGHVIHILTGHRLSNQNVNATTLDVTGCPGHYTQYGPIKKGRIKNQHSDFEKNKEPALRILDLKNRFTF